MSDQPPSGMFAKAGDVVTCESGHDCFRLSKDVARYSPLSEKVFEPLGRNTKPMAGQQPVDTRCAECGDRVFRVNSEGGWQMHIGDKWLP